MTLTGAHLKFDSTTLETWLLMSAELTGYRFTIHLFPFVLSEDASECKVALAVPLGGKEK